MHELIKKPYQFCMTPSVLSCTHGRVSPKSIVVSYDALKLAIDHALYHI